MRYPKYDLESGVEVAAALDQHGGEASAMELAALLGYSGTNNGAYLNRVAAARAFGLVEGEGRGATIRETRRAVAIVRPDYEATAVRARLEAFTSIPLSASFLKRYEGQPLPDKPEMQNALISMGVPAKNAGLALARLISSADQAGLFSLAPNKMIRPTLAAQGTPADEGEREGDDSDGGSGNDGGDRGGDGAHSTGSRLVDAVIAELPTEKKWTEDGLKEWTDLLERALRVHYGLPRKQGAKAEAS